MKQWFRYIFSRSFLRTAFRLGIADGAVGWVVDLFEGVHPTGFTREMPALKGATLQEASEQLAALGLIPAPGQHIQPQRPPVEVIDQVPPAASKIKAGRKVYLTTYRSTPPYERLGIEGARPGIARIILENKGFEVKRHSSPTALVGADSDGDNGKTLSADDRRPKGTRVVLISGTTTRELVGVPNVKGLYAGGGANGLLEAKLSVGLVEFAESVEDASIGLRVCLSSTCPTRDKAVPAELNWNTSACGGIGEEQNRIKACKIGMTTRRRPFAFGSSTCCFWACRRRALQPVAAQTPAPTYESERDLVAVPMMNDTDEEPRRFRAGARGAAVDSVF